MQFGGGSVKCDFNYLNLPLLAGLRSFKTSLKFMRAQLSSCGSAVDSSHLIVSILVLHVLEITSFRLLTEINKSYFILVQL